MWQTVIQKAGVVLWWLLFGPPPPGMDIDTQMFILVGYAADLSHKLHLKQGAA